MVLSSLAASCCRCAENPLIPAVQISAAASLHEGSERLTTLGLAHRVSLQVGDPVSCIVNAANEANADLVVVGHHKSGWLVRWLHESVVASLIESLDCSVSSAHMDVSDDELFGPVT